MFSNSKIEWPTTSAELNFGSTPSPGSNQTMERSRECWTCELHQYASTSITTHISDISKQTFGKHSRGSRSKTHKLSNEELQVSNDLRYSASNQDSYTIQAFRGPHSCSPSSTANLLPQRPISSPYLQQKY